MNLIVSLPSGPRPGNLTCGPQEKNRLRKTNPRGKKKTNAPSPRSLPASGQEKQMPPRKKQEPQRANPCYRLRAQRPRAAFSLLAGSPRQAPPRKSYLRASRKKNRPRKTSRRGKKKTNLDLFFLTGLGRQTNNQIHVPLCSLICPSYSFHDSSTFPL